MTGGAVMVSLPHPRPDGTSARWAADRGRLVLVRSSRGVPQSSRFDPVPHPAPAPPPVPASPANARVPLRPPGRSPRVAWFVPARSRADHAGQECRHDTRPGRGPGAAQTRSRSRVEPGAPRRCNVVITAARPDGMARPPATRVGPPTTGTTGRAGAHPAPRVSPSSVPAPPRARSGRSPARAQGQGGLPDRGRAQGAPVQEGGDPRVSRTLSRRRGCGSRRGVGPAVARAHGGAPRSDRCKRCLALVAPPPGSAMRLPSLGWCNAALHPPGSVDRDPGRKVSVPGGNVALPRVGTRSGPGPGGTRGGWNAALQRARGPRR